MPIEHEHKYLIEKFPITDADNSLHITQFYFACDSSRKLVQRGRATIKPDNTVTYELAHKLGSGETLREVEYEVPESVFNEMKRYFTIGTIVQKVRFHIIIDGLKWDVDTYNNGMIVAELENPPDIYTLEQFGNVIDVTGKFEYSNYSISMNGWPSLTV